MNDNNILYCKSVEGISRPARRFVMTFYDEMRALVLRHGAINNPYLDRFRTGALTDEEFQRFAVEFYNFARFFPKILVAQLVNTEDEAVADELTTVLYSELGDGRPKNRHELLYRDFLRSVGVDGAETGGLGKMTERERDDFRGGMTAVLGYLEGFWMGLDSRPVSHAA